MKKDTKITEEKYQEALGIIEAWKEQTLAELKIRKPKLGDFVVGLDGRHGRYLCDNQMLCFDWVTKDEDNSENAEISREMVNFETDWKQSDSKLALPSDAQMLEYIKNSNLLSLENAD